MSSDPWGFSALTAPERLAAIERAAVSAMAYSAGRFPDALPPAVLVPPSPPPPSAPMRPPPAPAAPVRLPRRPVLARLALPVGLALTAAGLTGVVAAATAPPPRIGPPSVPGPHAVAHDAADTHDPTDTADVPAPGPAASATAARATRPPGPRPLARSRPVRVELPARGVRAGVIDLGLRPDGSLAVPDDEHVSGWWAGGPSPGERGASVLVGHVDSVDGPGAFYPLLGSRIGDEVHITRSDGRTVVFRVYRVTAFPKDAFPTDLVYGAAGTELRLVTCSGVFDERTRHYRDNLVVFARRVR